MADAFMSQIFEELFDNDGLTVMARGLGIKRLLIKFLQHYLKGFNFHFIVRTFLSCSQMNLDIFKTVEEGWYFASMLLKIMHLEEIILTL